VVISTHLAPPENAASLKGDAGPTLIAVVVMAGFGLIAAAAALAMLAVAL
jgi:hypothetical protein